MIKVRFYYDYNLQVNVVDGRIRDCGHPQRMRQHDHCCNASRYAGRLAVEVPGHMPAPQRTMSEQDWFDNVFGILKEQLAKHPLPCSTGTRHADVDEFMLMNDIAPPDPLPRRLEFKHRVTRHYVFVERWEPPDEPFVRWIMTHPKNWLYDYPEIPMQPVARAA